MGAVKLEGEGGLGEVPWAFGAVFLVVVKTSLARVGGVAAGSADAVGINGCCDSECEEIDAAITKA